MKTDKFLLLGTDTKMTECKRCLNKLGYSAHCEENEEFLNKMIEFDNIILPLPTVKNGIVIGTDAGFECIVNSLDKRQNLFYGNVENVVTDKSVYSYYYNESFYKKNSRLTAQGTLKIILDNVCKDLTDLKVCLLGYGCCGKAICRMLFNLSVNVNVFTRSESSKKSAEELGLCVADINEIDVSICDFDVIINTVPYNIITEKALKSLNRNNLYIEIASAPYGFDIERSDISGFRYILASALPGKYTPQSVGENIAHTVLEILKEVKLG